MKTIILLLLLSVSAGAVAQNLPTQIELDNTTYWQWTLRDSTAGNQIFYALGQAYSAQKKCPVCGKNNTMSSTRLNMVQTTGEPTKIRYGANGQRNSNFSGIYILYMQCEPYGHIWTHTVKGTTNRETILKQ